MPVRYSEESAGPDTRRASLAEEETVEEETSEEEAEEEEEEVAVTPAAAELAEELGVDLASMEGTGKDGKITVGDVRAASDV